MKTLKILPILLMFVLQSCDIYLIDTDQPKTPKCDIVSLVKVNGSYSTPPKFRIMIENYIDNSIAYDIACEIEMRVGNVLVDRAYADFGNLQGDESAVGEAYVPNLISHSNYTNATLILSWYDNDGFYFEKIYYY
jgi:hypothetical protein